MYSHPSNYHHFLHLRGCVGSMVVHQTVKPAVLGSNLSNLQGHAIPCWGASKVDMITAGWPLRGGRGKKIQKYKKNNKKKFFLSLPPCAKI